MGIVLKLKLDIFLRCIDDVGGGKKYLSMKENWLLRVREKVGSAKEVLIFVRNASSVW